MADATNIPGSRNLAFLATNTSICHVDLLCFAPPPTLPSRAIRQMTLLKEFQQSHPTDTLLLYLLDLRTISLLIKNVSVKEPHSDVG